MRNPFLFQYVVKVEGKIESIEEAGTKATMLFDSGYSGGWVKWFHAKIPDEPEWQRKIVRAVANAPNIRNTKIATVKKFTWECRLRYK